MTRLLGDRTFSIQVTVLSVFLLVVCITVGLILGLQYYFSCDLAKTAAEKSFLGISEKVSERIHGLDRQSSNLVNILSHIGEVNELSEGFQNKVYLPVLSAAMEDNPNYYAIYIGCNDGGFFEVINLESSDSVRRELGAAPNDRWVSVKICTENGERVRKTSYLDSDMSVRFTRKEKAHYDPRTRPWYKQAVLQSKIIKTRPYMFSYLHSPGVTYAKAIENKSKVVAVDISLASMTRFLQSQRLIKDSEVFLFQSNGDVTAQASQVEVDIAHVRQVDVVLDDNEKAYLSKNKFILASNEMDWPPFDFAMRGSPRGYSIDLLNILAGRVGLKVKYLNGFSWKTLVELFKNGEIEVLHSLLKTPERAHLGIFTPPYLPMPQVAASLKGGKEIKTLAELKGKTVAIPDGWATARILEKDYPEIKLLKVRSSLDSLRAVQDGRAYATVDSAPVFHFLKSAYFLDDIKIGPRIRELDELGAEGLHFLVQPDNPILAGLLAKAMKTLTPEDYDKLNEKWLNFSNSEKVSSRSNQMGTLPHPEFLKMISDVGMRGKLHALNIDGKDFFGYVSRLHSVYGSDDFLGFIVPVSSTLEPYMDKVRFSVLATLCLLFMLIPLVWFGSRLIVRPISLLITESIKIKNRKYDDVRLIPSHITEIVDLSTSMVSMSSSIKEYEEATHNLMDSFIRLIATAIDHKSPYTGGHCERVPELAMMIGKEANESSDGSFSKFNLANDDEWREFRIAAWLHDCGKVTTPEHIVDKATKLETIYNRIHEIRMRFEVLLRDAEITYYKKRTEPGADEAKLKEELAARREVIKNDFIFIAGCNRGEEFMDEDKVERIHKIAEQTWVRYLDDRLGLGHLEIERYPQESPSLPHEEKILADKSEHIFKKTDSGERYSGFAMKQPDYLYNLGEVYNLCIQKGTLTEEDRFKVNEHIIATINMLEKLPYPGNMTKIPEFAGTHHETLIGTGYPRKLKGNQISMPGRILALADVFEALTASDRPYKKSKTLSESIKILSFMVKDHHLDAEVFRLFLQSGIYKEYAEKFLKPEQIDEVDIDKYINDISGIVL